MNPNIAHELINERTRDMLAEARQARKVRELMRFRRQQHAHTAPVQLPVIPDYVHELVGDAPVDVKQAS
jgi:hypothetical protein